MKKTFVILLIGATTLFTPTGCTKPGSITNPLSAIPDITNFLVQASATFAANAPALIRIFSSSLGNGTFSINYTLGGGYNSGSGTATLTMSGGSGTFSTSTLTSGGPTTVTVNSIALPNGGSASPTANNVSSVFDSTGLMTATYTPLSGSATSFSATQVTASLGGTLLTINAVMWTPNLTTINLYEDYYSGATGVVSFNGNDLVFPDVNSTFNGSASYGVAGAGITISDLSAHGSVTINTVAPLITGSFTYKNQDSSVVVGTFSCPAP